MTALQLDIAKPEARKFARLSSGDIAIIAGAFLYAAVAVAALSITDARQALAFSSYFVVWPFVFFVLFPAVYGLLVLLRIVHRFETTRGRRLALRKALAARHLRPFATGLILLGAMMIFQGAFTSIKTALPIWNGGFPHDVTQADLDRALHLGVDPWRYLYDACAQPWIRAAVEWNYNQGWFIVCYAMLFFIAVSASTSAVRTRYLITYMLGWVLVGNLLAGVFLSAGPAFYGHLTGDAGRFGEQLAFLAASGDGAHSAVKVQNYLWHFYSSGQSGLGSGISAFPSMHVGLVTLNALFIAEFSRRWGILAFAYVLLVLASSVYLAWHYAIDGYVAISVTIALFFATKRIFLKASAGPLPGSGGWRPFSG